MVKIFIGNVSSETKPEDLRPLFEKYGPVTECDVLKNYGFVHMDSKADAETAIANLDGYNVRGKNIRVELSTGKRANPKGDRRGGLGGGGGPGRPRPYPPRERDLPPPYDRYDPYYRYPYPERDPYYRLPPMDRYLPPRSALDRYPPLPPRDRLLDDRRPYPDDRLMPPRDRLPLYPEDRAYDRLRADRPPLPADPYYRDRSPPPARPPPEYYDRKAPLAGRAPPPASDTPAGRMGSAGYPSSNGYDYYRQPADRAGYGSGVSSSDYYGASRGAGSYDRSAVQSGGMGGYGGQGQSSRPYDAQTALQGKPVMF